MTCEGYEDIIAAHVDGALSTEERQEIEQHLTICERCQRLFVEQSRFRLALSARRLLATIPVETERRLRARLAAEGAATVKSRKHASAWKRFQAVLPYPRLTLGLVAASVLLALLLPRFFSSAPEPNLFSQAIESYQAVADKRLALSYPVNDPQRLQTALNLSGELNFITQVADLRSAGYQLKGGTIARQQGRPTALAVYEGERAGDLMLCLRQGGKLPVLPPEAAFLHTHYVHTYNGYTIVCSQFRQHFCLFISRLSRDEFLKRLGVTPEG